jgi:hypothetical protein
MAIKHIALVLFTASASAGLSSAGAAEEVHKLEMSAYLNEPGGPEIRAGRYEDAIVSGEAALGRAGSVSSRLIASTNLCVAYTVTGAFDKGSIACDRAIALAERAERFDGMSRRSELSATAKALSNRGVLRGVLGNVSDAAADFESAAAVARWTLPGRNLAYLESVAGEEFAIARN